MTFNSPERLTASALHTRPRLDLLRHRSLTASRDWPAGPPLHSREASPVRTGDDSAAADPPAWELIPHPGSPHDRSPRRTVRRAGLRSPPGSRPAREQVVDAGRGV